MAPRNRIIIDTDPGVDDILALLLAFSAKPEELEVLLVSLTFGNIDVQNCLRNLVSLFHWVDKEMAWRKERGMPEGFDMLRAHKPIVAVGAEEPLADQIMMADYFHGIDGLGGIHSSHPHLTPEESWKTLFASALSSSDKETVAAAKEVQQSNALFTPSTRPAHQEMLRLLRENEADTITIVAVGPLTNLAIAAAEDPETFLRAKEVVVMGGAIDERGNVSPVAEFNTYADSIAAARVYALTSPMPHSTMPPVPPSPRGKQSDDPPPPFLQPYPKNLSKQLKVTLFPLDITTPHNLSRSQFTAAIRPLVDQASPLATWTNAFVSSTFRKIESLSSSAVADPGLSLHDPLCIWYVLIPDEPGWAHAHARDGSGQPEDIRVETSGQWTRGMCVVERRSRKKRADDGEAGEVPGDAGNWLGTKAGNRVGRCVASPGAERFGRELLSRVFG